MKVYFAADHGGYELKNMLLAYVRDELHHDVEDCGAFAMDPADDYPGLIAEAAQKLSNDSLWGKDSKAIIAGGSGQGEAIVANRFKGVRCAVYYGQSGDQTDAEGKKLDILASSRDHNDANCLSLGARFMTPEAAKEAVKRWLKLPFTGDQRHIRRIQQIDEIV